MIETKTPSRVQCLALAVMTTLVVAVGLTLALHLVAPLARHAFGVPVDFMSDYSSPSAIRQAYAVQFGTLIGLFLAFGVALFPLGATPGIGCCLAAVNPITVAAGYGLYQMFVNQEQIAHEYFGWDGWFWVSMVAPLVLVPSMLLGGRIGRSVEASAKRG